METVVVLGASANPQRYSYRAIEQLTAHGHRVIPVHPAIEQIRDLEVVPTLERISTPVDTVTVYVNPIRLEGLIDDLIHLNPGRVILNPGTESETVASQLSDHGIKVLEACTLVMLATGQF